MSGSRQNISDIIFRMNSKAAKRGRSILYKSFKHYFTRTIVVSTVPVSFGTEFAFGDVKTALRRPIVSVIDRPIYSENMRLR